MKAASWHLESIAHDGNARGDLDAGHVGLLRDALRERQRAEEAETRLVLARWAVDELFRMSEEELADRPGMEMLRKRLLRSALAYYQEFLAEWRDDPNAQAELLETTRLSSMATRTRLRSSRRN